MTFPWHIEALNPAFGDPGFFLRHRDSGQALLFDLGDLHRLAAKQLLKIAHIFISHGHIDHLIGFDHLLRMNLNHAKHLHLYGPPGIIAIIGHKLQGYCWNLTAHHELLITAHAIHEKNIEQCTFACRHKFHPEPIISIPRNSFEISKNPIYSMAAATLDHDIDCLAFTLTEPLQIKFDIEKLKARGWPPGPWLSQTHHHLQSESPAETLIEIAGQSYQLQEIAEAAANITPGLKIAYVTDTGFNLENRQKLLPLIAGADLLLCEAAFLEKAADKAEKSMHLTAAQAGQLACQTNAKALKLFHFSPRHADEKAEFYRQAGEYFNGPIS